MSTAPPMARDQRALDGVSLTIRHGETIGVAGRSGGGKSTWLRVLLRLIHPSRGSATLGGVPLECISREAIGRLIGYVGQSPFVFAGTIAENIAYGNGDASPEQVSARRLDGLHPRRDPGDARRLRGPGHGARPEPLRRPASAHRPGARLPEEPPDPDPRRGTSAPGQHQRAEHPAGDQRRRADRTVILVAHRLTTLLDSDRIFVFDEGRIVETAPTTNW